MFSCLACTDGAEPAAQAKDGKRLLEELSLLEKTHARGSLKASMIQKALEEGRYQQST